MKNNKIILNIYDITNFNCILDKLGLGLYHTSVQINDVEYTYGSHQYFCSGISVQNPNDFPYYTLRHKILIDEVQVDQSKFLEIIEELEYEYFGCVYDIMKKNCNHFSKEFIQKLTQKKFKFPNYILRLSDIGNFFRCCFTARFLGGGFEKQELATRDSIQLLKQKQSRHLTQIDSINDKKEKSYISLEMELLH